MSMVSQLLRGMKNGRNGAAPPEAPFRLEDNFFADARNFRAQMEKQLLSAIEMNDGLTPFTFAYAADAYQFLTASAERVFSRGLLDDVINTLRSWATETLGASCVSTPQVRIYLNGCRRDVLLDSTEARYHWMLSLGPPSGGSPARIRLLTQRIAAEVTGDSMTIDRVASLYLLFNQLLVHESSSAYGIDAGKGSINPLEAAVFLDGYLW
jgi:hypothetical protein